MKNIIFKTTFVSLALLLFACSDTDTLVDSVFDNTTKGAVLKTIELDKDIPLGDPDAKFSLYAHVFDAENGALTEEIRVYAAFLNLAAGGANDRDELLLKTIPNSQFVQGPETLEVLIEATLDELLNGLNLNFGDITGGDRFVIRLAIVLKDGRVFTNTNSSQTVLGNPFLASPFLFNANVICPVPETSFIGSYTVTEAGLGVLGIPVWDVGTVVTMVADGGETRRSFDIQHIPAAGVGQPERNFAFDLVCGNVSIVVNQPTGLQCATGLFYGPAPSGDTGNYDVADDSVITFVFTDNSGGDCGEGPREVTATLTKN